MKNTPFGKELIDEVNCKKVEIEKGLITWGLEHYRTFDWRENKTPYSVLISEVLLKRTTASAVVHVYLKFLSRYPNIETLSQANKKELEELLKRIGYHKQRTEILLEIAQHVKTYYGGKIPSSQQELLEIPHIGEYTANALLSFGFCQHWAIVDSNVERIIKRIFEKHFKETKSKKLIRLIAIGLLPENNSQSFNYNLLDFGALVCKYGVPRCKMCPINQCCDYFDARYKLGK